MVCFPKHFYQNCKQYIVVRTPLVFLLMVWALPISLATTLGIIFYFLFLWVLRCFSSPRSLLTYYFTHMQILRFFSLSEFPHSDIYGSMDICSSPQLFAAYRVLLRLLVPRHSPYALCSLTFLLRLNFTQLCQTSVKISSIYICIISSIFLRFPCSVRLYCATFLVSLLTNFQCLTLSLCLSQLLFFTSLPIFLYIFFNVLFGFV